MAWPQKNKNAEDARAGEAEAADAIVDSVDLYGAAAAHWERIDRISDPDGVARADIDAALARLRDERRARETGPTLDPDKVSVAPGQEHEQIDWITDPDGAAREQSDAALARLRDERRARETGPTLDPDKVWKEPTPQEVRDATLPELSGNGAPAGPQRESGAGAAERPRQREDDRETTRADLRARRATPREPDALRGDDADPLGDAARQRDEELKNVPQAPPEQRPYRDTGMGHVGP